jgi:aminomethyltransferase
MTKMLKRSPHFAQHMKHNPKGTFDFAGWEMPTHFTSLEEEIGACRSGAILVDGHAMGELHVCGKDALKAVQKVCVNDLARAEPGQCVYTSLCKPDGGILDDLVAFCISPEHWLLTVAAFNTWKTPGWVEEHIKGMNAWTCDQSAGTACLEIQGPKAREILARVADFDVSNKALPYFRFVNGKVAGIDALVARLGVTGELGYEIFYDAGYAYQMYDALLDAGRPSGMALCGNRSLGIMRLEKVYHVYTRDIDETTNPFEAGMDRTVKLDKGDFIGRDALAEVKRKGVSRRLVGLIAAPGTTLAPPKSEVLHGGRKVGHVTLMAVSPTLGKPIALAYVTPELSAIGTTLTVAAQGGTIELEVTRIPFYDPDGTRIRV